MLEIIKNKEIPEVLLIKPKWFSDERGFFLETYSKRKYSEYGLDVDFVQDNHSFSKKGVLRGLHYQLNNPQGKLVYVVSGEIFDVIVDIRIGSPTYGKWVCEYISEKNKHQFYIPPGFAHGFLVLSESANVIYKCTNFYTPGDEYGIIWNDSYFNIIWPINNPILSEKDSMNKSFFELYNTNKIPFFNNHFGGK